MGGLGYLVPVIGFLAGDLRSDHVLITPLLPVHCRSPK